MAVNEVGRRPSKSLFFGFTDDDENAIYDIEHFHKVFVECEDITEYQPAVKLVGSWPEWNRIKRDWPGFGDYIKSWLEEVETKLKSDAVRKIVRLAHSDEPQAFQAAKFLATREYDKAAGAGRPSKADKERAMKDVARAASETAQEEKRILKVLNGGSDHGSA